MAFDHDCRRSIYLDATGHPDHAQKLERRQAGWPDFASMTDDVCLWRTRASDEAVGLSRPPSPPDWEGTVCSPSRTRSVRRGELTVALRCRLSLPEMVLDGGKTPLRLWLCEAVPPVAALDWLRSPHLPIHFHLGTLHHRLEPTAIAMSCVRGQPRHHWPAVIQTKQPGSTCRHHLTAAR
jgi:hypothetical protein